MATYQEVLNAINDLRQLGDNAPAADYMAAVQKLRAMRDDWVLLGRDVREYSYLIKSIVSIYREFKHYQEGLDFLDAEYEQYKQTCQYEYVSKSQIYEIWADLLLLANHGKEEILLKLKLSVYYIFIDNTTYSNFELFSFRCFPGEKDKVPYSLNDIRNNTLSFASPTQFNDPMDTILIRWNDYRMRHAQTDTEKEFCRLYAEAIKPLKVRCFARNNELPESVGPFAAPTVPIIKSQRIEDINSLMWAHYTDSHKGFCVKYSFPSDFVMNNDHNQLTFTRIGNAKYAPTMDFINSPNLTVKDALFKKHDVWAYEKEVRIVHYDPSVTSDFKTMHLPEGCIKEIYLGIKCSSENEQKMRDAIGARNIPLYKMEVRDNDAYHLVPRLLAPSNTMTRSNTFSLCGFMRRFFDKCVN